MGEELNTAMCSWFYWRLFTCFYRLQGALLIFNTREKQCHFNTKLNILNRIVIYAFLDSAVYHLEQGKLFETNSSLWIKLFSLDKKYVMFCAIGYHLHNFKKMKNTHGGVLLLVSKVTLFPGCFSRF